MSDLLKNNERGLLGCCGFLLGAAVMLIILFSIPIILLTSLFNSIDLSSAAASYNKSEVHETIINETSNDEDIIAVIRIDGVISSESGSGKTSCHDISTVINHLLNDEYRNVKALIVCVNSPGGEVTASDVIYNALNKVKEKNIPIIVQMESMAASGGYYISCNANHIVANPTTFTGSIGVIISGLNIEEGMNKLGIHNQVFTSGEFKDMLSPTRAMRPEEAEYIQSLVNESYDRFVQLVSTGRSIPVEKLKETKAIDGRIISGEQAHKIGLVDSLGYWDETVSTARTLGNSKNASVIRFQKKTSFSDLLFDMGFEARAPKRISVEVGNTAYPTIKPGLPYMLPYTYVTGSLVQP